MDRTVLRALYVILISFGLAILFNYLFFGKLIGVSVVVFSLFLLGAVKLFGEGQLRAAGKLWWIIMLIAFFTFMPAVRANEFLNFLNICATLGLLLLLARELVGTPAFIMKLRDYIFLPVLVPLRMLGRALSTVSLVGQIHSSVRHRDVLLRMVKGVIMALPALVVFGVLFSQADLAFSQFIRGFVQINISERSVQYLVLLSVVFVAVLGFFSYIFFPKEAPSALLSQNPSEAVQPGRGIEVLVFLGLISALFLIFIGFQVAYLFGGEVNIANAEFTYAEYARRGFWELLVVALLSLAVLLASEKYAGTETKKDGKFLAPALILVVEVFVVIVSAFKRLSLYIDAYGMTLLRFYVGGFILLLLVLFALLAYKFIMSKREEFFAFGAVLLAAAFLLVVNMVNPDAYIMKYNLERYQQSGKLDVAYLRELSADAVSLKVELYKQLEGDDREALRESLQKQKDQLQKSSAHWQSANFSRAKALKSLREF